MFALVLTGSPGAGKSSVLEALSDALVVDDVRHAMIEIKALTRRTRRSTIGGGSRTFESRIGCTGSTAYNLLLAAATVESDADLRGLLAAVDADVDYSTVGTGGGLGAGRSRAK